MEAEIMRSVRWTWTILAIALAFLTAGCANLAESAFESAVERGVEAAADGEDVDFDLDLSNGSAEVSVGDSTGAMGADLDRPDWLDDDFDLPEGLSIITHSTDTSAGQSIVVGHLQDANLTDVVDQQRDAVAAIGYDVVDGWGGDASFRALASNGRVVEVSTLGTGEISQYSIVFFEADSAHAVRAVEDASS